MDSYIPHIAENENIEIEYVLEDEIDELINSARIRQLGSFEKVLKKFGTQDFEAPFMMSEVEIN